MGEATVFRGPSVVERFRSVPGYLRWTMVQDGAERMDITLISLPRGLIVSVTEERASCLCHMCRTGLLFPFFEKDQEVNEESWLMPLFKSISKVFIVRSV